jgi:hypothetical protein
MLAGPSVANGAPLSFEDVYDPSDLLFSRTGLRSLTFTHDLATDGFDPLTDTVTGATLSLYFEDDGDPSAEKVDIMLDDVWAYNNETITSGTGSTRFTFNVALLVAPDGTMTVSLTRQNGTFYFGRSILNADADRAAVLTDPVDPVDPVDPADSESAQVPEPAPFLLLGIAVLGAAGVRRWRQRSA